MHLDFDNVTLAQAKETVSTPQKPRNVGNQPCGVSLSAVLLKNCQQVELVKKVCSHTTLLPAYAPYAVLVGLRRHPEKLCIEHEVHISRATLRAYLARHGCVYEYAQGRVWKHRRSVPDSVHELLLAGWTEWLLP